MGERRHDERGPDRIEIEEGVLRRRLPFAHGAPRRDAVVSSLLAEELRSSPAALAPLRTFDCRGQP